jgi:hypothetical protein
MSYVDIETVFRERLGFYECVYCDRWFSTEPIRDEIEVFWRGVKASRTWCSEDCVVSHAESLMPR